MSRYGIVAVFIALAVTFQSNPVQAGCGCDKAPPPPTSVRPNATAPGMSVSLFADGLEEGAVYSVTFESGITGEQAVVDGTAVLRRDLADGVVRPQIVVDLPEMPLGPTAIDVEGAGVKLSVPDADFTTLSNPALVPNATGPFYQGYEAAVSRDGIVYLTLDVSEIQDAKTIKAHAAGYPLRFTEQDVVFYNTQGFLMQLLDEGIPGLFAIEVMDEPESNSDQLQYARHEFNSYFLQHEERDIHEVDPVDPEWHLDGTPHIDHNVMVLAIDGRLPDGSLPVPGATPGFMLVLNTDTLFADGVVGVERIELVGSARVDSYDSFYNSLGSAGEIVSNGDARIRDTSTVAGDVTGATVSVDDTATVTGICEHRENAVDPLAVNLPRALPALGEVRLAGTDVRTIVGPGSFQLDVIEMSGSTELEIDNTEGPVTLYVTGNVHLAGGARILPLHTDPERFALYVTDGTIALTDDTVVYGVVYGPTVSASLAGRAEVFGTIVAGKLSLTDDAQIHYDVRLRDLEWWALWGAYFDLWMQNTTFTSTSTTTDKTSYNNPSSSSQGGDDATTSTTLAPTTTTSSTSTSIVTTTTSSTTTTIASASKKNRRRSTSTTDSNSGKGRQK